MPDIFVGPLSQNIVDAMIAFQEETGGVGGLIASRRQVDYRTGYTGWTTPKFSDYVRARRSKSNVLLCRDHGGPLQGARRDLGERSFSQDAVYMEVIHIDPWVAYSDYASGVRETVRWIRHCAEINSTVRFEVGTEETIRRFDPKELERFLSDLRSELGELFCRIRYAVVQAGTSLCGTQQTGVFRPGELVEALRVCHEFGVLGKEHNGDYQSVDLLREKAGLGLDAINIAPEFGVLETQTILQGVGSSGIESLYALCRSSNVWKRWMPGRNFPLHPGADARELISVCGHYFYTNPVFKQIKSGILGIDQLIKSNIKSRLYELHRALS